MKIDFQQIKTTPAFVFDEAAIIDNLTELVGLKNKSGCQVLYSIKALPLAQVLALTKGYLNGLSVSSLFEARLAKDVLTELGSIHITTPGLRDEEFQEINALCSHVSFNSLNQYQRLATTDNISLGLRINPKLSFSNDARFDPCRPFSKLGIELEQLTQIPKNIEGLHFHTVFSNNNYQALESVVELLERELGSQLGQLKWLNLGGGYLYQQIENHQPFINLVRRLKTDYEVDVFIEPGKAIVNNAGYLVSQVIDIFISDGKPIAVLDTSVNHNPEVFEYQSSPKLLGDDPQGKFSCLLVGSSCLAGDVFGEYQFNLLPKVGDRLVFSEVGAYSLIKANRFNGYNLPDIYWLDRKGGMTRIKQSHYQDYYRQWSG